MSENGEPSTKRRHTDMDDIPSSMQFFKWAQLGKRSAEAINEIRSLVWNCKNKEASDILYMFMKYYDSQMQKEKEYKERKRHGKETGEDKNANENAVASGHPKQESKVENKREEDSDVQFLMERRSEILREINEDTGEEKVEDSEMEALEDVTVEDVITDESGEPESFISSPDRSPTTVTPVAQPIPQLHATQPAPKTVIIKQEPAEAAADPTHPIVPDAAQIPAATTSAPVSRGILKKPKPEPIETSRKASVSAEEPTSPTVSTVAVADEPLTSPPAKLLKMVKRPAEALRPKLPSAPANLMPAPKARMASTVHDHCSNEAAITAPKPARKPDSVSKDAMEKKQQVGGVVQTQSQQIPMHPEIAKAEQSQRADASPKRLTYQQYKQQKQKQQDQQKPLHHPQQEHLTAAKSQHQIPQSVPKQYNDAIRLEPERQQGLLAAKTETLPAKPLVPHDPVVVAILSNNLVALNKQAEHVNDVKELAHAQNIDPESEYLSIVVEQFADPGNTFTLKYFRTLKIYLSRALDRLDLKLNRSTQPSVLPLQIRLRVAKMEIESIWERVRGAIGVHRVKKKAAYAQRVAVARLERGSSNHQGQQSVVKRPRADSSPASQWVPPPKSKRTRAPLLETPPPVPSGPSDDELCSSACDAAIVCAFCNEPHDSIDCTKFTTYDERENIRQLLHLCWSCLAPFRMNHLSRCEMHGKLCSHCGNHASHAALCRKLLRTQRDERHIQFQMALPREKESPDRRNIEEEEDSDDGAEFSPQSTPMHEEVETEGDEKPNDSSDSE